MDKKTSSKSPMMLASEGNAPIPSVVLLLNNDNDNRYQQQKNVESKEIVNSSSNSSTTTTEENEQRLGVEMDEPQSPFLPSSYSQLDFNKAPLLQQVVFLATSPWKHKINNIQVKELLQFKSSKSYIEKGSAINRYIPPSCLVVLNVESSIAECLELLGENRILSAPVLQGELDNDGKYEYKLKGVVDILDIILLYISISSRHFISLTSSTSSSSSSSSSSTPTASLSTFYQQPIKQALNSFTLDTVNKATEDMSLLRTAECLRLSSTLPFRTHRLPVYSEDGQNVIGIVSLRDILSLAYTNIGLLSTNAHKTAKELRILQPIISVPSSMLIGDALYLLPTNRICGLAVTDSTSGKIVSTLNCSDLRGLRVVTTIKYDRITVVDFLKGCYGGYLKQAYCFTKENTLVDLIKIMAENNTLSLYMVDEKQCPIARVSMADVVDALLTC